MPLLRRHREANGDAWAPKWFEAVADADADVLPNEPGIDKVPAWRWKGQQPWAAAEAVGQGPAISAGGLRLWGGDQVVGRRGDWRLALNVVYTLDFVFALDASQVLVGEALT